jgi:hypothetical protein
LFGKIKEAAVPPKVANDFLYAKLGLNSTSYRAMIPLLKRMGFIDEANVPTPAYRDYGDEKNSKIIMARLVRNTYKDLFATNEYAYKLIKEEITSKLNAVLGTPADDKTTPKVAATFLALCNLADFEGKKIIETEETPDKGERITPPGQPAPKLGLLYNKS